MPFKKPSGRKEPAIRRTLRNNLRNRRIKLGMTAKQLADKLGVASQWVHAIENPRTSALPGILFLERLAVALGTTPANLLTPGRFSGIVSDSDDLRGKL